MDANFPRFPALAAKTGPRGSRHGSRRARRFPSCERRSDLGCIAARAKQAYRLSIASPFPMQARPPTIAFRQPAIVTTWDHGGLSWALAQGRMVAGKAQTELAGPQSSQGGKFGD